MARILYWAYGSNLSEARMQMRCPGARRIGPLTIGGALVFRGVADVEYRDDHQVAGGLWKISAAHEAALDRFEGVARGLYIKKHLVLRMGDGSVRRALYYKMARSGIMPPSEVYLDAIIQGYHDFGLDLQLLDNALMEAWGNKKMTKFLRQHRREKGGLAAQPHHMHLVN